MNTVTMAGSRCTGTAQPGWLDVRNVLKIIEIKELKRSKLPKYYRVAPHEVESEAVSWAEGKGADVLYKFVRTNGTMWLVEEQ